jgi:cytochrome c peroxidase
LPRILPSARRAVLASGLTGILALGVLALGPGSAAQSAAGYNLYPNEAGMAEIMSTAGMIDQHNLFFSASLGTNGRSCSTCHELSTGLTITPSDIQARFNATQGQDPIFRTVDGSNSPNADVSTVQARQTAYSMLLNRGVIRIGLPMPANADFTLVAVDDPYHFASAQQLSLFRRPLPTDNLRFLSSVMWDGRETLGPSMQQNLTAQALNAIQGHLQATQNPTSQQLQQIVNFETPLFTAQEQSNTAGSLEARGATGGPVALAQQNFYPGINDSLGHDPTGKPFNQNVLTEFRSWTNLSGSPDPQLDAARQSVARGEKIFDTRTFQITGVAGLNDVAGKTSITGTCSTCHDTPSDGSHSLAQLMNTGVADGSRRTPDLPLYTFQCNSTGATVQVTDPGQGLVTGKCADLGKFKVPSLRGLETRSPYFHDGSADSLQTLVTFYNTRFTIGLSTQDQSDLIAFLQTL